MDAQNSSIAVAAAATAACAGRTQCESPSLIPDGEERDLLILVVVVSEILSFFLGGGGNIGGGVFLRTSWNTWHKDHHEVR
jgi:hypothetical protein